MKTAFYKPITKVVVFVIDFGLIYLAFLISKLTGLSQGLSEKEFSTFFLVFSLIWIIAGFFLKVYRIQSQSLARTVSNLIGAFLVHTIMLSVLSIHLEVNPGLVFLISIYVLVALFATGLRIACKLLLKYIEFSGFDQRNVVIIGFTQSGRAVHEFFTTHREEGYNFKGFFDDSGERNPLIIGGLRDIMDYCISEGIDEIYFTLPLSNKTEGLIQALNRFADDNFIYFRIAPDFSKVVQHEYDVFLINSIPILTTRKEPLGISVNQILKRVFDIAFSLAVILFLFPFLFAAIALAIRLDSPGPILFKQLRPGKKNKLFECYKFRTMSVNDSTELQATRNDSRITKVGKFLRKTNLDELPQFFNVLLGDMSVVGPRPNMVSQLEVYSKTIKQYRMRHFINPGITGYAQVHGFRGETREIGLMEKRVEYDVLYMENWSLALDIKIIFLTVWNMLKGDKNAY